MDIEIIFAEFGSNRGNAGDAKLPKDRLQPSMGSFKEHFPEARFTVYTDQPWKTEDATVKPSVCPFDTRHDRYGWRCNDYFQAYGLITSTADVAIAMDSDLVVHDKRVRAIIPLAQKFGLCMPVNGRHLVWRDARSTCDGGPVADESLGMGMCQCTAFWAYNPKKLSMYPLLDAYLKCIIRDAALGRGARGPLSFWRACWETGSFPYTLPIQWCVTGSNLDVPEPVILHVGHDAVKEKFGCTV